MYSWEMEQFIKERDFYIGGDELAFLVDVQNHPQISYIGYNADNNSYSIHTSDNYYFNFSAMPIVEADQKGLVKKLVKE